MLIYTILSCVILALLAIMVTTVAFNILTKNRKDRIRYIRQFKKGKGAMIYIVAIPLLIMGEIYKGASFLDAFFIAIPKSLSLVVLSFNFDTVGDLMAVLPVFKITIYIVFFLILVNAILLAFSLFQQQFWAFRQRVIWKTTKKQRLVLIGYNQENLTVYNSEKNRIAIIVGDIPNEEKEKLYINNIRFFDTTAYLEFLNKVLKDAVYVKNKPETVVVLNTASDEENIAICRNIIKNIENCNKENALKLFNRFRLFVYGKGDFEAIYADIEDHSKGCITYLNKYRQIAIDFVDKYPFTKFMDDKQIDKNTCLISNEIDINAIMIGFGKTNRQVFLTSVANNQFLEKVKGKIELKKVNYFVFDRSDSRNDKNLNHSYYRFNEEIKNANEKDYLPLPPEPANDEFYYKLDINDHGFYSSVRKIVCNNTNNINFVIIAYGSDLDNLDMAQKLLDKKREWGVNNLVLFVKVRESFYKYRLFDEKDCYPFGVENESVFNINRITNDNLTQMAKLRNRIYCLEKQGVGKGKINTQEVCKKADLNWYTEKTQAERESNIYACLSLRSKLNLLGLDYELGNVKEGITEKQFLEICSNGKNQINVLDERAGNRRENMAIQEHYRWNAYMISKGFVPATIDKIINETVDKDGKKEFTNGKNYRLRSHGNLTTWEGLKEFSDIIARRDNVEQSQTDVMKYDYQVLDEIYMLLSVGGYKIINKAQRGEK